MNRFESEFKNRSPLRGTIAALPLLVASLAGCKSEVSKVFQPPSLLDGGPKMEAPENPDAENQDSPSPKIREPNKTPKDVRMETSPEQEERKPKEEKSIDKKGPDSKQNSKYCPKQNAWIDFATMQQAQKYCEELPAKRVRDKDRFCPDNRLAVQDGAGFRCTDMVLHHYTVNPHNYTQVYCGEDEKELHPNTTVKEFQNWVTYFTTVEPCPSAVDAGLPKPAEPSPKQPSQVPDEPKDRLPQS